MASRIDIQINDQAVLAALGQLRARAEDLAPAMREIAGLLADIPEQAFADEADPATGEAWTPLAARTLEYKQRKGYSLDILRQQGFLAASIQSEYGDDYAAAGTNRVYAGIHQFGGKAGRRAARVDIPARPFLGTSPDHNEQILAIVTAHLRPN